MVGDDPQGDILLEIVVVGDPGDLADMLHNVLDGIHLKEVIHPLHDTGQSLQAHTGIDVGVGHGGVGAVSVGIELAEYQVPDLHKPVTVAAHMAIGLAAALVGAPVKVDLGAGAAGTGADLPEIVLPAEPDHVAGVDAHLLHPDIPGLVVAFKDGDIKLLGGDLELLCQKLPGPGSGLVLKVVPEGEVAQHLKVGAVAGGLAHVLDIRGADALLAGGDPLVGGGSQSQEEFLHGGHTGVNEQQAGVIPGDQGVRGQPGVSLSLKEAEEVLPEIVQSCPFHSFLSRFLSYWIVFLSKTAFQSR